MIIAPHLENLSLFSDLALIRLFGSLLFESHIGSTLLAQWSNESVFYAAAVPAAIAALSSALLAKAMNGAPEPKAAALARH